MTRPTLARSADGIYRPLDVQIADRMRPVEAKRDAWFWLKAAWYFTVTALISAAAMAGVVLALVFIGLFAAVAFVPWVCRKAWRAGR